YLECGSCGTLEICEIPDLSRYYPKDYYSLNSDQKGGFERRLKIRLAVRFLGNYLLNRKNFLSRLIVRKQSWFSTFFPNSLKEPLLELNFRSRILDFGCGRGELLQNLYYYGFRNLTGADAFIENDIFYPNGVKIYKRPLSEIEPFFDFVMLHHSFEHLPNPLESLREIYKLLRPGKVCLIRIPVAAFAWEKYGVNWVQLDPPRHLFLFTEKSFRDLAKTAGFEVAKVVYDSEAFQFFGSERYVRNLAMNEDEIYQNDIAKQLREWEREAEILNKQNKGDQACFYLRKP
ncbi:MAG: class I SAM-dependent methyltransferase, partial [Actinomycetota bacterium]